MEDKLKIVNLIKDKLKNEVIEDWRIDLYNNILDSEELLLDIESFPKNKIIYLYTWNDDNSICVILDDKENIVFIDMSIYDTENTRFIYYYENDALTFIVQCDDTDTLYRLKINGSDIKRENIERY